MRKKGREIVVNGTHSADEMSAVPEDAPTPRGHIVAYAGDATAKCMICSKEKSIDMSMEELSEPHHVVVAKMALFEEFKEPCSGSREELEDSLREVISDHLGEPLNAMTRQQLRQDLSDIIGFEPKVLGP